MRVWVPMKQYYPSSTLFRFLFGCLPIKTVYQKKGTLIIKGLLGNLEEGVQMWGRLGSSRRGSRFEVQA